MVDQRVGPGPALCAAPTMAGPPDRFAFLDAAPDMAAIVAAAVAAQAAAAARGAGTVRRRLGRGRGPGVATTWRHQHRQRSGRAFGGGEPTAALFSIGRPCPRPPQRRTPGSRPPLTTTARRKLPR